MNRWRMWAGVLAVFLCGLVIGGVGGYQYERQREAARFHKMRTSGGSYLAEMAAARLHRHLGLTPEQAREIKPLLLGAFGRTSELHQELRPRSDQIMREAAEGLKARLTPQQAAKLEKEGGWRLLLPSRVRPPLPEPNAK